MGEWRMLPGRHRDEPCAEGHRCCAERIMHGHSLTLDACPRCSPGLSPYQAVEMVAAAVEDRRVLEAEVERLRAALKAIAACDWFMSGRPADTMRAYAREALEGPK